MESLKTLKGSKICRSKFGVGKRVGNKIYVHKDYVDEIIPYYVYTKARSIFYEYNPTLYKEFNCVCYDLKNPHIVRFDMAVDFDTSREPSPGMMFIVDIDEKTVKWKYTNQIWHHKWMWVKDDYEGFDVKESWEWSKLWLSKVNEVASGSQNKWSEQLRKVGL